MAKLFLESTDTQYVVSNSNTAIFGATGSQAVILDGDLTGITLNSNVERVEFDGATTDYTYKQTGTQLEVYNSAGVKVTTVGLTSTGSQLTFAEGTVTAKIVPPAADAPAGTAPTVSLGDTTVNATTAAAVTVPVTAIDKTISSAPAPVFSVSTPISSVTEAAGATATFTVTLNAAQPEATTVTLGLSGVGTATTADYGSVALATGSTATLAGSVLTFPAGTITATVTVPVSTDALTETGEGVKLTLSAPSTGASVSVTPSAEVLINDPPAPVFSLSAAATTVIEGNTTANTIPLVVTRSGDTASAASVVIQTTAGTGSTGASASDFVAISQTVSFLAGETTKTINFSTVADTTRETDETLTVSLGTPSAGSTIDAAASSLTLTITNDDANLLPAITTPTTTPSAFIGSSATAITGVSFTDGDDNTGFSVTVQAAGTSQVSFTNVGSGDGAGAAVRNSAGAAVQANESANTLTIAGPKTAVNYILGTLGYTSNSTVPTSESVTITVTDAAGGVATKTLAVNIGKSGSLTSSNDSLLGSAGDDQFSGALSNLATTDTIDGGLGNDKLTLTTVTGTVPTATISNVEILDLTLTGDTTLSTLSTTNFGSTLTTVTVNSASTTSLDLTVPKVNTGTTFNINKTFDTLTLTDINGTAGTTDAFTVSLGGDVTVTQITGGASVIDALTINSNGSSTQTNTVTGFGTLTSSANITLAGSQQLTITTLPTTTGTISGAAATGKLVLQTGASDTKVTGGSAGDSITGGAGNDSITGGAGNDTLSGAAGNDTITGGTGADSLSGGTGIDTFVFAAGDSPSTGRDTITDLKENDKIMFGTALTGLTNGATIGTTGNVHIDTTNSRLVVGTDEITIPASVKDAAFTYSYGTDTIAGTADDYILVGAAPLSAANNQLGTLTLTGKAIGTVAVVLHDSSAPTVGGTSTGTNAVTTVTASNVTNKGINVDSTTNTVSNALSVTGTSQADTITGGSGNDTLVGGAETDSIDGGAGNDSITGGDGIDTITGGAGNDTIDGGAAGDSIDGGAGSDSITGSEGADTITGGAGLDTIALTETTAAADKVILASLAADADTISGFVKGSDVLDLSAPLTAATLTIGTQVAFDTTAKATTIVAITAAANTDAPVYYIKNTAGHAQVLTLTEIETAITAGSAATGEMVLLLDNGTDTLVYFDLAAETDAGSGAGLILVGTLSGITGATALATGDLISV